MMQPNVSASDGLTVQKNPNRNISGRGGRLLTSMTNEELALQIQSGDRTLIPQLWAQVERFVRKMANRYADKVPGAEDDDLYQTGFLAMLRAVDRYEEPHSFLSGLVFALKREYAELGGYLTSKRDPFIAAVSLDAPLSDEDDSTLQDLLADPLSPYEGTEQAIWNAQARAALDAALDTIPEQCAKTIRALYFESSTETAVAASRGVSVEAIRQQKVRGLQYLRARAEYLNEYSNLNPYSRNTLASYNRTGSSGPELAAMRNEYRLRKLKASIYHPENAQK